MGQRMVQRIEFKVGLFIIITSLLIVAAIGYVAVKKGVFSKFYTYTLSSKTGDNLTEGMPVTVWGVTIGRVSSLELNEQGTVLIRIKIPERHVRMIRVGSKFVLDKPLIGTARIVVNTSNLNALPMPPGFVPELTESNDINEIIKRAKPIVDKTDRIMGNVEQITAMIADPQGDLNRILRDMEVLISRLSKKESILEMAVGDPESVKSIHEALRKLKDITARVDGILQRVDAMAGKADGIVQRVDTMAGKTDEQIYGLDGVLPQFRNILRDLLAKLAKLDVTFDNINKVSSAAVDSTYDLRVLRNELDVGIKAIGDLADEIDRKIPFKKRPEIKLP
jgi:phospholipid/cholesterol/gamma-HCH transport system substrate-binding protein